MQSLARGWLVLAAVVKGGGTPVSVKKASELTNLSVQTVRRCFYTLTAIDCIRVTPSGAVPGPGVADLAHNYAAGSSLLSHGIPIIERLRDHLGVQTTLTIYQGNQRFFVKSAYADAAIRYEYPRDPPMHCSAAGKLFLAELTPTELTRALRMHPLTPRTEHSIATRDSLEDELERVRRRGHAISDQELDLGIRSVAVPVRDPSGKLAASINVTTLTAVLGLREIRANVVPTLVAAAAELEATLG